MTVFNTIDKISRRAVEELEDLNIAMLEASVVEVKVKNDVKITSPKHLDHNAMTHIGRRKMSELKGLLIATMERSKTDKKVRGSYKLTKPRKKYNAQLKLRKGYSLNLKG